MNGMGHRQLVVVLLVAGSLGFAGSVGNRPNLAYAEGNCTQSAMMDPMMADPSMMMDPMMSLAMDGESLSTQPADVQANYQAMWGDCAAAQWVKDHNAAMAMMYNMMARASDGQSLSTQSADVQVMFAAVFGVRAGAEWVQEHEAELSMMHPSM